MNTYRGGLPILHSRRQRGSGFLSVLKRFALPIAKKLFSHAAPQMFGAVTDIFSGGDVKDTLKRRATQVGSSLLRDVADTVSPPAKRRRAARPPTKKKYKKPMKSKRWH